MHILFFALGSSFNLILSANAPVQLTTCFAYTWHSFWLTVSLKQTPITLPDESLMKSVNYALLSTVAGLNVFGIVCWLPLAAVMTAAMSSLESLKDPS